VNYLFRQIYVTKIRDSIDDDICARNYIESMERRNLTGQYKDTLDKFRKKTLM